jgi:hypothetical protein
MEHVNRRRHLPFECHHVRPRPTHLERENIRQSHESARLPGAHSVVAILAQAVARTLNIASLPLALAPSEDCPTGAPAFYALRRKGHV